MTFLKDIRAAIHGMCAEEIELAYGPAAGFAFRQGERGLSPHGRFAKGGVLFLFCLEGVRQYGHDAILSRRVARLALERAAQKEVEPA
jgi:hypothetical protein